MVKKQASRLWINLPRELHDRLEVICKGKTPGDDDAPEVDISEEQSQFIRAAVNEVQTFVNQLQTDNPPERDPDDPDADNYALMQSPSSRGLFKSAWSPVLPCFSSPRFDLTHGSELPWVHDLFTICWAGCRSNVTCLSVFSSWPNDNAASPDVQHASRLSDPTSSI